MERHVTIMVAASAVGVFVGLYEIITRTLIFRDTKGADAETIRKMAPYEGLAYLIMAAGILIVGLKNNGNIPGGWQYLGYAILAGGIVYDGMVSIKFLGSNLDDDPWKTPLGRKK